LSELRIVSAQEKDLDTVLGILNEAAEWLASRGISGWWRPGSFSREAFLGQMARGEVYLAKLGGEAVGTIILQWKDRIFWKEVSPDAGYVHKFAIRRAYAGRHPGPEDAGMGGSPSLCGREEVSTAGLYGRQSENTHLLREGGLHP
jgi:hypothetical protein